MTETQTVVTITVYGIADDDIEAFMVEAGEALSDLRPGSGPYAFDATAEAVPE